MKTPLEKFKRITSLSKELGLLQSIDMLLGWDKETYMPKEGIKIRSKQKEYLASLLHEKKTSKEFAKALSELIDLKTGKILSDTLDRPKMAALREWRRDFQNMTKLPPIFVKEHARLTTEASKAWVEAKNQDSFELFAPYLEKIILQMKEMAEYLTYTDHPYDALLDLYEPEITTKKLKSFFSKLKPFLIDLTRSMKIDSPPSFLTKTYDEPTQLAFSKSLLHDMGLTDSMSRVDLTEHPFCMAIHPKDIRLTTHVQSTNLMANILANLHEGGHGLYEAGLPEIHFGTPLGSATSFGIHESQSRIWETMIGLSLPFWEYYFPRLQKAFPTELRKTSVQDFYRGINLVSPSLIRIFADEVTYCLHVILRFELETEIMEGKIEAKDIPEFWNTKMQEMLGIIPQNDATGCLQDIHWSLGYFGYFPSYALGNIYAGQLFMAMRKEFPDFDKRLRNGDLLFIKRWLGENIHQYGRQYSALELIEKATGEPLQADFYMSYLKIKYESL